MAWRWLHRGICSCVAAENFHASLEHVYKEIAITCDNPWLLWLVWCLKVNENPWCEPGLCEPASLWRAGITTDTGDSSPLHTSGPQTSPVTYCQSSWWRSSLKQTTLQSLGSLLTCHDLVIEVVPFVVYIGHRKCSPILEEPSRTCAPPLSMGIYLSSGACYISTVLRSCLAPKEKQAAGALFNSLFCFLLCM